MLVEQQHGHGFATSGLLADISATEFELLVTEHIAALGKSLTDFSIKHNAKLSAHDGVYQIDVLASYTALNVNMMVLIECKRHSYSIPRETVQLLRAKLHSSGAHKGIIFSTSGFQDGAIQYALRHKIGLITVLPGRFFNITNSLNSAAIITPTKYITEYLTHKGRCYISHSQSKPFVCNLLC